MHKALADLEYLKSIAHDDVQNHFCDLRHELSTTTGKKALNMLTPEGYDGWKNKGRTVQYESEPDGYFRPPQCAYTRMAPSFACVHRNRTNTAVENVLNQLPESHEKTVLRLEIDEVEPGPWGVETDSIEILVEIDAIPHFKDLKAGWETPQYSAKREQLVQRHRDSVRAQHEAIKKLVAFCDEIGF